MTGIIRKIIQTRTSLDKEFFVPDQEVIDRVNEYADENKCSKYEQYTSEDGLTNTIKIDFFDLDYYAEMGNESIMMDSADKRHSHCVINDISYRIEETDYEKSV